MPLKKLTAENRFKLNCVNDTISKLIKDYNRLLTRKDLLEREIAQDSLADYRNETDINEKMKRIEEILRC